MGYKLAGFDVIGNCEIDPRVLRIYKKNLHPKYPFNLDIRDFNKLEEIPEELIGVDILDGSPPCSVFSTAGQRENAWGKEKAFREGQKKQRLDDLFFAFLDTAKKLQPKVIVAENVEGLIKGNAKGYANEILARFRELGYIVQMFLLNAATMGVPQARKRVFFVAYKEEFDFAKLKLDFNEPPILFGEVRTEKGIPSKEGGVCAELLKKRKAGDRKISDISERERGRRTGFTRPIFADDEVAATVISSGNTYRFCDGMKCSNFDFINTQTFPQDYDFLDQQPQYVCGMSVPPVMMANIATEIYNQWLSKAE